MDVKGVLTGFVLLAGASAAIAGATAVENIPEPAAILSDVSARGAPAVVRELYDHRARWSSILRRVELGEETWLRVAVALRPGTDAGSASELHDSVTAALAAAPINVLRVTVPKFPLTDLCSGRHDPPATYEAAVSEVDKMMAAVASIKIPELSKRRDDCLRALEASRADLKRFFAKE